jgi:pyridoxal phosphate enzyme (YggS family)
MTTIAERMQAVKASINAAATDCGRNPDTVQLLAVSKAHPAEKIREAHAAGQRLFGENYLQEALDKQGLLADLDIEWHFIGPIQSNKTQPIAQQFAWVHGVDRLKIAERLHAARPENTPPLQVCIQVNVSGEASKSGIPPQEVISLAQAILQLPRLKLRGLMSIPAPTSDIAQQRDQFRRVGQAFEKLRQQLPDAANLDTLSIGMSEDYAAAIAEGATIVRIGSAIFGARPVKNREPA